jgi:hypothetical protein
MQPSCGHLTSCNAVICMLYFFNSSAISYIFPAWSIDQTFQFAILNSVVFILLRCMVRFPNIQSAILDWDFTAKFVFQNCVAGPVSNPHPGGPGFDFGVFPSRRVSFSPWFSFRVFLPLAFGVSPPHPQGSSASACLLVALTRQVTRPSWRICDFSMVVVLP